MSQNNYSVKELLSVNPIDLADILSNSFIEDVPSTIESIEELKDVGAMLSRASNGYSFLSTLASHAKLNCRQLKRCANSSGAKLTYEDAVDRKDIINNTLEAVKLRYKTLSRLITIKQEINTELKFTDGR